MPLFFCCIAIFPVCQEKELVPSRSKYQSPAVRRIICLHGWNFQSYLLRVPTFLSSVRVIHNVRESYKTYAVHPRTQSSCPSDSTCKIILDEWDSMIYNQHHRNDRQRSGSQLSIPSMIGVLSVTHDKMQHIRTLVSGVQIRVILSIPTPAKRFPSQFHATWVIAWGDGIRRSRGLCAGKFCAWFWTEYINNDWSTWILYRPTCRPRAANVVWRGGDGGRWRGATSSSSLLFTWLDIDVTV
jgi:hypothetical protein